jgi:site-specific recombinase XerD
VTKLDLADYDLTTGRLTIRGAKRNKEYTAYIEDNGAQRAMADWLTLRGDQPGPIFWAINRGGNMTARRLSAQAIYNMLVKRAKQAGIAHFSPHDLRRSLAGDLLDAGADIVTVQKILGHANVTTTARYDRRPEDAKRRAAGLVHVPYRGRKQQHIDEQ